MMNEKEFQIGPVKFRANKMNALDGFTLMEKIRHQIGSNNVDMPEGESTALAAVVKIILTLDPGFVAEMRDTLFRHIEAKTPEVNEGWLNVFENQQLVFATLEPAHIYELIARGLAVNFTDSWSAITSKLPVGLPNIASPKP